MTSKGYVNNLFRQFEKVNEKLENALNEFQENMKTTKNTLIDKDYVKIKRETFDSMNKVVNESKKVMELQPKIKKVFNEVSDYSVSYTTLEKENKNMKREINALITKNQNLNNEINQLKRKLELIFKRIKQFLRELLQYGNEKVKELTSKKVKDYYINNDITKNDVYNLAKQTTKEDELFDFAKIPSYYKTPKKFIERNSVKNKDYEISL